MFLKKQRLTTEEFNTVFKNGVVFRSKNFILRFLKGQQRPKFAVSVSKKVKKTAVQRNYVKRKVFSAIKDVFGKKDIKNGGYVFIVTNEPPKKYIELIEEIKTLLLN